MNKVREVFFSIGDFPGRTMKSSINSIICFGWKRLGEAVTFCENAWDYPAWKKDINDDYAVCEIARRILQDADGIVTHNGKRFDLPFLNGRLVANGLKPLPPILHVDTYQAAKKLFLYSNSLKNVGKFLKCKNQKLDTGDGPSLWAEVAKKNPDAMAKMTKYCKGDVRLLEEVYKKLLPFAKDIPNYNFFKEYNSGPVCPRCGSHKIHKYGQRVSTTGLVQRYHCQGCGGFCQDGTKKTLRKSA